MNLKNFQPFLHILAKNFGSVISWNQVLELGNEKSDHELDIREKNTAVNKACMYMYTSGTTGSPKGNTCIQYICSDKSLK